MEFHKQLDNNKNIHELPLVSILLAIYDANYSWLKEQLISLNSQSYSNLELIIYDDCPEKPLEEEVIEKYIDSFSYKIIRGKQNLGSNAAFEKLTTVGNGQYFAYCDQDDIWESNKIEILFDEINKKDSVLAYSDMSVIDENGITTDDSLLGAKPRIKYIQGEKLFSKFFFKNCISGCCMLVKRDIAKRAVPFSKVTIHDQWICIISSIYGTISYIDKPLVRYRIHGSNQTGSLKGIYSKDDYYNMRINILQERLKEVKKIGINIKLDEVENFCNARIKKKLSSIFKYRYLNPKEAYFEILMKYMPNFLFRLIIAKLK
jgi:glycosyltransferase involved in cell wall biosynthesis